MTNGEAPAVPLLVRLAGRRVVSVGGGRVAADKLLPLIREHGALVHVVAPRIDPALEAVAQWTAREYQGPTDLDGAALVVAATAEAEVNARVADDAAAARLWCVRVDRGGRGSATFPATVRRGPLTFSVGTDGGAPVLARWLRADIDATYGPEYGALAQLLGDLRRDPAVVAHLAALDEQARRRAWRSIPLADILAALRAGSQQTAKEVATACLFSPSD